MINGVIVKQPDVFTDYRGDYWTTWEDTDFDLVFNHDKVSTSGYGVLRGIHGDNKSWKLVTCLYGSIYFVIVDNRPTSDTYMLWESMILDDKKRKQVLIPPGVGNGFFVLSDHCVFQYKWSYEGEYPDVEDQFSIKWNDPKVGIDWPKDNPILSKRDK
jgi:dTDP-4-dehydrorhamnose 3,5-epimerase